MELERKIKQKESLIQKHQNELKKLFDSCTHKTTAEKVIIFLVTITILPILIIGMNVSFVVNNWLWIGWI
jgi:hypothetical protein